MNKFVCKKFNVNIKVKIFKYCKILLYVSCQQLRLLIECELLSNESATTSTTIVAVMHSKLSARNSYWRERLSTVYLRILASWDQRLFLFKILFIFFTKQAAWTWRSTVLTLPLQLVFPDITFCHHWQNKLERLPLSTPFNQV